LYTEKLDEYYLYTDSGRFYPSDTQITAAKLRQEKEWAGTGKPPINRSEADSRREWWHKKIQKKKGQETKSNNVEKKCISPEREAAEIVEYGLKKLNNDTGK